MENETQNIVWQPDTLAFYLSIYYSNKPNWLNELEKLRVKDSQKDSRRKKIAFTIIGSMEKKIRPLDPPEALLFAGFKFDGFNDEDWISKLEDVYRKDEEIKLRRNVLLSMGSIAPVEYHPRSRQGLQWMLESVAADDRVGKEERPDVSNRMKSMLLIYGPTAICSLYQRNEIKAELDIMVPNWRTGYFLEKALYRNFSIDAIVKMKQRDLDQAPKELVKTFGSAQKQQTS